MRRSTVAVMQQADGLGVYDILYMWQNSGMGSRDILTSRNVKDFIRRAPRAKAH